MSKTVRCSRRKLARRRLVQCVVGLWWVISTQQRNRSIYGILLLCSRTKARIWNFVCFRSSLTWLGQCRGAVCGINSVDCCFDLVAHQRHRLFVAQSLSMFETISIFKYANFNVLALCRLVSKLREGQVCICDTFQILACDSYNWTILVSFLDDLKWMLRSPRDDDAIRFNETNILLLTSEVATLKYIKANNTIFVLEVFAYRQVRPLFLV